MAENDGTMSTVYHLIIDCSFLLFQVPYNVAFKNKTSEDVSLLVVDSIVDVIFFIDIGKYIHVILLMSRILFILFDRQDKGEAILRFSI